MKTQTSIRSARPGAVLGMIWLISLADPPRLAAADFLRGDANGDGVVSMADAQTMVNVFWLGHTSPSPADCPASWDADGDGTIGHYEQNPDFTVGDLNYLLSLFVLPGSNPPPAPFPTVGPPDPALGERCDSYGGGSPLPDPEAELKVVDAVVEGRTDGTAFISVLYSSSSTLGGLSGTIHDEAGVFFQETSRICEWGAKGWAADMEGAYARNIFFQRGTLQFGLLTSADPEYMPHDPLPPGKDVPLFTVRLCLVPGTPPGDYPLTLTIGGFAELESGRAIVPRLVSGVLHVTSTVGGCRSGKCRPSYVNFRLDDATATPGGTVAVPFSISAFTASQGFAISVDFDEEILEAEPPVEKLWQRPNGTPYEFEVFDLDNRNKTPGNAGVDEGFIVGAAIFSLTDTQAVIPPQTETPVLRFHFRVKPQAPAGITEVKFLDGGQGSGGPVQNKLLSGGQFITPGSNNSFVFVNSRINIIPDGTPFVRGDSNDDGTTDVSDAPFTLGYLFLGGTAPRCDDAADANDDGVLDVTDPIATLSSLFLGGALLPAPYPAPGQDPTGDGLPCPARS